MLLYKDGRFAEDKFFTFFAMNYLTRKRNASSGNWFITNFQNDSPQTLDELKERIANGDTKFINGVTYYSKRIKGSTSYWHQKRSELYTWINHHVERGHGAPLFFITLSCAENYWPDVMELIKERLEIAGKDSSMCYTGSPEINQLLNDYTIVVQEYFQKRVETWLKTVGKDVFGIEHYWVRYEFAPGRGQIHAHLLGIPKDRTLHMLSYDLLKGDTTGRKRADVLGQWAADQFGLTAMVSDNFDEIEVNPKDSPVSIRFSDVMIDKESMTADAENLMKHCMMHDCSNFCLREDKNCDSKE